MIKIAQGQLGDATADEEKTQLDEAYMSDYSNWKYAPGMMDMTKPQTLESWKIQARVAEWKKSHPEEKK